MFSQSTPSFVVRSKVYVAAFSVVLLAATLALLLIFTASTSAAGSTRYVAPAPTGHDTGGCTNPAQPCASINYAAQQASNGDTISVSAGIFTETVGINKSLMVQGAGAGQTIVDANNAGSVFAINGNLSITLTQLTLQHGHADGGGVSTKGHSTVLLRDCAILENRSTGTGGGGVFNHNGLMSVINCTLSGNTALYGSAVLNLADGGDSSTLIVANSTLSGNTASGENTSAAVDNSAVTGVATIDMLNDTVADNTTVKGGLFSNNRGAPATIFLTNMLLANNSPANLVVESGGAITSHGHNLSSDDAGGVLSASGDMTNTNPLLAPLGNYGGRTQTHALYCGSPAIDHADSSVMNSLTYLTLDERGFPRNGAMDIGAYEMQPHTLSLNLMRTSSERITAQATYTGADPVPDGERVTFAASRGTPEFLSGTTQNGVAQAGFFVQFSNIGTVNATDACGRSQIVIRPVRYLPMLNRTAR